MLEIAHLGWAERIEFLINKKVSNSVDDGRLGSYLVGKFISADEEKKEFTVEFKIERWMENPRAELHGGALSAMFDMVTGIGSSSVAGHVNLATLDLYVNFLSRADGTDTMVLKTKIVRAGRRFIRLYSEGSSKATGKLIGTCTANYAILADDTIKPRVQI